MSWRKSDRETRDHFQHFRLQGDIANHNSLKALRVRQHIHGALNLFNLFLLLIQRGAIQVQQGGGDTDRKVVGVHLVRVSTLQDVMKDANKMFQEGFIRPRKLVCYPGSKMEKGCFKKGEQTEDNRLACFLFLFRFILPSAN